MKRAVTVVFSVLAVVLALGGCRTMYNTQGPLDSFVFLAADNAALSVDVNGVIQRRGDPKMVELVVPPGTQKGNLVATFVLNTQATVTVVSSGLPMVQLSGENANNFSVPVTYSIQVPGEKKPWNYRVTVRDADQNARLAQISFPEGYVLDTPFEPSGGVFSVEVPYASAEVKIEARGQSQYLKSINIGGFESRGTAASAAVDFRGVEERSIEITTLAEDGFSTAGYTLVIRRGEPDRNANLDSLELVGYTLSPSFAPARQAYQAIVPFAAEEIILSAVAQSTFAAIELSDAESGARLKVTDGTSPSKGVRIAFSTGDRLAVNIAVTAQDGGIREYILLVLREPPDGNNRLAALTVNDIALTPFFTPGVTSYTAYVPFATKNVTVTALTQSELAEMILGPVPGRGGQTFVYEGGPADGAVIDFSGIDTLEFSVRVTAQDGGVAYYGVNVRRLPPDSNADLGSIALSSGIITPPFSARTASYIVFVPADAEDVVLTAIADSPVAVVSDAGGKGTAGGTPRQLDLVIDTTISGAITLIVTAEDGSERLYLVSVKREAGAAVPAPAPVKPPAVSPDGPVGVNGVLAVSAKNLRIEPREMEQLAKTGATLTSQGRVTARRYRSGTVLFTAAIPVQVKQQGRNISLDFTYRSAALSLKSDELVAVEISIPLSDGRFLHYTEAVPAAIDMRFEPPFLFIGPNPLVAWPEIGTQVPVTGYVSLSPPGQIKAADTAEFSQNERGEYGITVELTDKATGRLLARETVWDKPGLARGMDFTFSRPIILREGTEIEYTMTAIARNGRAWRSSGTATVWTTRPRYEGGFEPVSLFIDDILE